MEPQCALCGKEAVKKGFELKNYCIDAIPAEIFICKQCGEKLVIDFMSGRMNIFKIFSSLKQGGKL